MDYFAKQAEILGLKTVAQPSGVSHGTLSKLVYGDRGRGMAPSERIRPRTNEAILAVRLKDAAAAQKVPAGPTWALLGDLLARGYARSELARALGSEAKTASLQIARDRVRASTARRVEELHHRLVALSHPGSRSSR